LKLIYSSYFNIAKTSTLKSPTNNKKSQNTSIPTHLHNVPHRTACHIFRTSSIGRAEIALVVTPVNTSPGALGLDRDSSVSTAVAVEEEIVRVGRPEESTVVAQGRADLLVVVAWSMLAVVSLVQWSL
jgi:hypothetical protein